MDAFQFYGIDWIATVTGLLGAYFLGNQNKVGFMVFMFTSICWVIFGFLSGSYAVIVGSSIFFLLHTRGLVKWIKKEAEVVAAKDQYTEES